MNKIEYGKFAANKGVIIMLFLIKAIIMPNDIGFCAATGDGVSDTTVTSTVNLTTITWKHAVNSVKKLENALKTNVSMIEADIFIGQLIIGDEMKKGQVIMAHGPDETFSDLSLEEFLKRVNDYNTGTGKESPKGIKLDFKSSEAFEKSQETLKKYEKANYEIWLNADIVKSSFDPRTEPVAWQTFAEKTIKLGKQYTLSVGWTTQWTDDGVTSGKYTDTDVADMIKALGELDHPITFPVRAGPVTTSQTEMKTLLAKYKGSTLTIWSSPSDEVNVHELQTFIKDMGVDKVYLDVPKLLLNQLNLGAEDKPDKSSANKLTHIGLLTIVMFILTKLI